MAAFYTEISDKGQLWTETSTVASTTICFQNPPPQKKQLRVGEIGDTPKKNIKKFYFHFHLFG